jgi:hypothetical protein
MARIRPKRGIHFVLLGEVGGVWRVSVPLMQDVAS